jgi:hypothetical protein
MQHYIRKPTATDRAFRYLGPQDLDELQRLGVNIRRVGESVHAVLLDKMSDGWCTVWRGDWIVAEPDGDGFYASTDANFRWTHEVPQ